jgi:serine/threonine-protein kinase
VTTRIGPYEILFELAAGGLGTVHVALHRGPGGFERLVVIKQPHKHLLHDREFVVMFRDEARLASSIRHPNVVPVTDVVEPEDQGLFLVMDYVDSVSLAALLKTNETPSTAPPAVVSRMIVDALHGLHASHEANDVRGRPLGIVHRDVSPQNILVGADGIARVIDFGIARATHRITSTAPGQLKGKYAYMSPEQVESKPVDRRSDVFSAGIVLFEALSGTRLFKADNEAGTIRELLDGAIPPVRTRRRDLPEAIDDVLAHALSRDVEERFSTAQAFATALESAIPPARAAEVAAWLKARCGGILVARAEKIERALHGAGTMPPEPDGERASTTIASAVAAPAEIHTSTSASVQLDAEPKAAQKKASVGIFVALGLAAALAVVGVTLGVRGHDGASGGASASASANAPAPATPSASATPTPSASASATDAATASASASAKSPRGGRAPRHAPSATTTARPDLRDNPYGN